LWRKEALFAFFPHPIYKMLQIGMRFSAVLLIGVLIAVSGLPLTASTPAAPAGCHSQSHSKSMPQPVSYQCCVVGHSPALQPDIVTLFIASTPVVVARVASPVISESAVVEFSKIAASPPRLTPLRI
jgi:hypothetical protein